MSLAQRIGQEFKTIRDNELSTKVDKISGKGLSTEDYSTTEKTKLTGIEAGAQVNDANTTLQGNTFNGVSQLVQTDGAGKLPAIDGSQLTGVSSVGSIDDLTDVDTSTVAPSSGDVLEWNGVNWVPLSGKKLWQNQATTITPTANADYTLTADQNTYGRLKLVNGSWLSAHNIIVDNTERSFLIDNSAGTYTATVKTSAGIGIAVAAGTKVWLLCDGTNVAKSVDETITTVTSNLFGRIWNITDDVYKRVGLRSDRFAPATQNEFTTWLSPSATRVNDKDTSTPSDLTIELDTNTNLPFSYIARKVVNNTGVVSAFDHATAPTATQQIMSEIPKCYYIDALIVSDTKEYDIKITSMTPFSIDVINDLGFVSVTSITCFNPTAGISSGTVVGNVITSALHPAFLWSTGAEASHTYVGSFTSVTGRSTFGAGVKPTVNITLPTARTQHTAFGTNFNQHDFWNNSLVQLLAYIERGTNYLEQSGTKWDGNSSSYDGSQTSYDQDNGLTLGLQNRTGTIIGSVADIGKVIANSYRGIENYHSAVWVWIDGVNINGGICYLAKAGSTFVSDIATAPYFASGYTATVSTSWASINKWQAGTFIPHATTGGTTSSKVSDQMVGETGWRVLLFGGSLNNAGISGLSCWNGYYASSNSNWNIASRASFRKFL